MRFFDILFSGLALIILSPIFLCVALILKFTGEGEIFFKQERVGQFGKKFQILKFATMLRDSPNLGTGSITSKDDPRILPFGKYLRITKINELPQLVNILKGDMSIIGPRPHVKRDLQGIPDDMLGCVLKLRPGLSGVGSIMFRNEEIILQNFVEPRQFYDELIAPYKAELEIWYFNNKSIILYFKLIALTIFIVIFRSNKIITTFLPTIPKPEKSLKYYLDK
ncbi:sugar transferase [Planktomarina temperata]|nr:sugar transferase [Planktomarina temperata]